MAKPLDTQLEAWEAIQPDLRSRRATVYAVIRSMRDQGATTFEVTSRLGWEFHLVSARISEMRLSGAIVDSGERRENPDTQKKCAVWRAADYTLTPQEAAALPVPKNKKSVLIKKLADAEEVLIEIWEDLSSQHPSLGWCLSQADQYFERWRK